MRKIFAFLMTSVDGYHEGRDGQFDWPVVDREFSEFSAEQLDEADTLLFGHRTYQTMAAYWPTAVARASDPRVAAQMNDYPKIVVSRTAPTRLSWGPTQVLGEDFDRHLTALKAQTGKDIAVLGSSQLITSLLRHHLIDELRIMVHPVLLGSGRPALANEGTRRALHLRSTRTFASGAVLLVYQSEVN